MPGLERVWRWTERQGAGGILLCSTGTSIWALPLARSCAAYIPRIREARKTAQCRASGRRRVARSSARSQADQGPSLIERTLDVGGVVTCPTSWRCPKRTEEHSTPQIAAGLERLVFRGDSENHHSSGASSRWIIGVDFAISGSSGVGSNVLVAAFRCIAARRRSGASMFLCAAWQRHDVGTSRPRHGRCTLRSATGPLISLPISRLIGATRLLQKSSAFELFSRLLECLGMYARAASAASACQILVLVEREDCAPCPCRFGSIPPTTRRGPASSQPFA